MADLLLYNRPEWCNADGKHPERYKLGDVVDIKPTGFWTKSKRECGVAFKACSVPGKVEEWRHLLEEHQDERDLENPVMLMRRKNTVAMSTEKYVTYDRKEDLAVTDNTKVKR